MTESLVLSANVCFFGDSRFVNYLSKFGMLSDSVGRASIISSLIEVVWLKLMSSSESAALTEGAISFAGW